MPILLLQVSRTMSNIKPYSHSISTTEEPSPFLEYQTSKIDEVELLGLTSKEEKKLSSYSELVEAVQKEYSETTKEKMIKSIAFSSYFFSFLFNFRPGLF